MFDRNIDNGDLNEHHVDYQIWVARTTPTFGEWELRLDTTLTGKTVTPYELDHRVSAPSNSAGESWQFKLVRLSLDDSRTSEATAIRLIRWSEIQIPDVALSYPHTALAALTIDAKEVGNQIPARGYLVRGIKVYTPSNYDVESRDYIGDWDGNFKSYPEWTSNPAWILLDLIINPRYGIGSFVNEAIKFNRWEFYNCALYSDIWVDDGYGGEEPRFTFNGVIQTRSSAWQLIQIMASVMRAVVVTDSNGEISLVQDRPSEAGINKIFTNANVIEGIFTYTSTNISERITSINVTFNDRNDRYLPRTISEPLSDDERGTDLINRYGFNLKDVVAFGTVTEGQARRFAKWLLFTSNSEHDSVAFSVALNIVDVEIGQVIAVTDNDLITSDNTTFFGGRILDVSGTTVTLDVEIDIPEAGYTLSVMNVDYEGIIGETTQTTGLTNTLILDAPLPAGDYTLHDFTVWKMGELEPKTYRIIGIEEQEKNIFVITATHYNPDKWNFIEHGINLPERPYTIWKPLSPITGLAVTEDFRNDDILETNLIRFSWDYNSKHLGYKVWITRNGTRFKVTEISELFIELENIPEGRYVVTVQAIGLTREMSVEVVLIYDFFYENEPANLLPPINFRVVGGGTTFASDRVAIGWEYNPENFQWPGHLKDY
ncbi:MAG: hypothetical protein DRH76_08555, partial [Deltaproteobacteria bacterium]